MLCTLLLLLIIFPIRFANVDSQVRPEVLYNTTSKGSPRSTSGFWVLSQEAQIVRYMEWHRQNLQKQIEKQIQDMRDHLITESVRSSGRGMYIVDLSNGKYLLLVFKNKIILKIKIG